MRIAITGASGFIGSSLSRSLENAGHHVSRLVRRRVENQAGEIYWNPSDCQIDKKSLEGYDAVINLAGKNLSERRWSERQKILLRESRIRSSELLAQVLSELVRPPAVLISASAIGYYGNRTNEVVTETSPAGRGFLAQLCMDWKKPLCPPNLLAFA